jgi:FAD/FMN-containing dehydrogenase
MAEGAALDGAALQARCRGEVRAGPACEAYATNFGRMCRARPSLVLRPLCVEDVQAGVRFAGERGLAVTVRAAGHSQGGQGLGDGLVIDMTTLNRLLTLDVAAGSMEVEAGILWRDVVDAAHAAGGLPLALTHALDTTVGGTLSVAGVGAMSWNVGPQVDHVMFLDVVTAAGDLVRCDRQTNVPLFDAVRGGLGQFGIIVRAGIPVRPCGPAIETRRFLYQDMAALLEDAKVFTAERATHRMLAVHLARDPLRGGKLMAAVFVGQDVNGHDAPAALDFPRLHAAYEPPAQRSPTWTRDGAPGHHFFRVFGAGSPAEEASRLHPWVDVLFPFSSGAASLAAFADNANDLLLRANAALIFVRRGPVPAPFLVVPEEPGSDLAVGLGLYPSFAEEQVDEAARAMQSFARGMLEACAGVGKRYPCGYFGEAELNDWAFHYGPQWLALCEAKERHDPARRFDGSPIAWPAPPAREGSAST